MLRDRDAAILRTLAVANLVPGPATPTLKLRRTGTTRKRMAVSRWGTRAGKPQVPEELYKDEIDRKFLNGTTWYKQ